MLDSWNLQTYNGIMNKKELILQEAAILFAEKGYYGVGLAELLGKCGVPKGSFYYYFPGGKIQLIQEVLKSSYQRMKDGITPKVLAEVSACEAFQHMTQRLAEGVMVRRHYPSMLMSMIAIESVYLDEGVNATCREIYSDWQKMYADFLVYFGMPPEDSVVKAQAIFALVHGSLISSWIKRDSTDLLLIRQSIADVIGEY